MTVDQTTVAKALNALLLVCCLANFLVIAWAASRSKPKIERYESAVVSNHVFVVTQVVERVSQSADVLEEKKRDVVGFEVPLRYHYFLEDGKRFVRFFGRVFGEGSLTSYGRISRIFPERIEIEDNVFIKNTLDPDLLEQRRVEQLTRKESLDNERIRTSDAVLQRP